VEVEAVRSVEVNFAVLEALSDMRPLKCMQESLQQVVKSEAVVGIRWVLCRIRQREE